VDVGDADAGARGVAGGYMPKPYTQTLCLNPVPKPSAYTPQVWARVAFGGGYMLAISVSVEMHASTTSRTLSFDGAVIDRGHRSSRPLGAECLGCPRPWSPAGVNAPASGQVSTCVCVCVCVCVPVCVCVTHKQAQMMFCTDKVT
jgi:hypothetical protein